MFGERQGNINAYVVRNRRNGAIILAIWNNSNIVLYFELTEARWKG